MSTNKNKEVSIDEEVFNGLTANTKDKTYEEKVDLAMEMGFPCIPSKEESE